MEQENRVVVLIDMDCFYCQVEEKLNPELKGKPIAVVQYNPWKGGGIIAVNYVARAMGVTRHMRGDEAKEKCPEIELPSVPCLRGKADISKYRDAGKEVAKVLQRFTPLLERASIDEAYLDITATVQERLRILNVDSVTEDIIPNTFALGYDNVKEFIVDIHNYGSDSLEFDYDHAKQLLVGAVIVSEIRAAVYNETGYRCSAGIAHNKILAKLVCGMNKPDKQTILPKHSINILYSTLSITKVKNLGGKFGVTVCNVLKINTMGQLQGFTLKDLQLKFDDKNGLWLYNIAHGVDLEPVQAKFNPKSIGCCKQFRGKSALVDLDSLKKWLADLGEEIEERLEKDSLENNRMPKQMVVSFSTTLADGRDVSSSRSYNFAPDDDLCGEFFTKMALDLVMDSSEGVKLKGDENNRRLRADIKFLGISVGKFEDNTDKKRTKRIVDYFAAGSSKETTLKTQDTTKQNITTENRKPKNNDGKEYILQKFFQCPKNKDKSTSKTNCNNTIETTLEKQESFFAQFINSDKNSDNVTHSKPSSTASTKEFVHPPTPVCEILNCGDASNEGSEYSGSTINMEINKSIALFDENDDDLNRISNMRNLLNSTKIANDENCDSSSQNSNDLNNFKDTDKVAGTIFTKADTNQEKSSSNDILIPKTCDGNKNINQINEEVFPCEECNEMVPIDKLDTHADYHLALRLRDEERQQARHERIEITNNKNVTNEDRKKPTAEQKSVKTEASSIVGFFVKVDSSIPTEVCLECGKRVPQNRISEHLDFHEAQKLSRELNKKVLPASGGSNVKRKRLSTSPIKKLKVPCKSIDSFFK